MLSLVQTLLCYPASQDELLLQNIYGGKQIQLIQCCFQVRGETFSAKHASPLEQAICVAWNGVGHLDCIGVLRPQPCSQHAAIAASKCNDRAAFSLVLLLQVVNESSIVGQGLLDDQERGVLV